MTVNETLEALETLRCECLSANLAEAARNIFETQIVLIHETSIAAIQSREMREASFTDSECECEHASQA